MGKQRHQQYHNCPMEAALDLIGGKWKSVILSRLLERNYRFNEIRHMHPTITQRMLTIQLRELERDGFVHRKVYAEVPPRVEYSITDFGKTLEPVLLQLKLWGENYAVPRSSENRSEPDNQ